MENPTGKPSKEQLQQYFNMSRQYFDELANRYKETDKAYYDQYIAPFYSPFANMSSGAGAITGKKIAVVVTAFAVFMLGMASFIILFNNSPDKDIEETETMSEKVTITERKGTSESLETKEETEAIEEEKHPGTSDYEMGNKHFDKQQWTKAEEYYKKVGEDDEHYDEVQIKLLAIRKIKDIQNPNSRRNVNPPKTVSPK